MNPRISISTLTVAAVIASAALAQSPFTTGNLVVVRVGDGTSALAATAAPIFLDEYTSSGTLVQSIALPTAASGINHAITVRGNATSEAYLNVSTNGLYLLVCGYDASVGAPASLTQDATAATTNRVIARIDLNGSVDTSTALTDAYSGPAGNPRAVVSDNGQRFWSSGTSVTDGGMRFIANLGATTSLALNAGAPSNCRIAGVYDSQLYTTSASTVHLGVCQVGTGLPTTPSQTITLLPGFPTTGGTAAASNYDFFFADPDTLYVADDNAVASTVGGIQKWTFNGTIWTMQYRLQLGGPSSNTACRGLTGFVQNGVTTLWGTVNVSATGGAQTQLVTVTDTGPGSVVTSLATSPVNTAFRGLRLLALPSTIFRIPATCGSADIKINGNGQIGTDVRTTVLGAAGFPFIGYGLNPLGLQFCSCTIVHDFSFLTPGSVSTLSLPLTPGLIGIAVYVQGLDFLAPGGCPNPMFTLTDGFTLTIQ